jgi:hypothetical protein
VPALPQKLSWRDVLAIHPAADLFPLMSPDELRALGEDIKANGLKSSIALWTTGYCGDGKKKRKALLLDGRNRLDAMELVGIPLVNNGELTDSTASPGSVSTPNVRSLPSGARRSALSPAAIPMPTSSAPTSIAAT